MYYKKLSEINPSEMVALSNKNQITHEITVVEYYFNEDINEWGFGFNNKDGGEFLPLKDLNKDTTIWKVNCSIQISYEIDWKDSNNEM